MATASPARPTASDPRVLPAAVAGQFYPAEADSLTNQVDSCLNQAPVYRLDPKAIIAPHAGYVFSGPVAGTAYRQLAGRPVRRVVLVGPAHRVGFRGLAVPAAQLVETPIGQVPVDRAAIAQLSRLPGVTVSSEPFRPEHSLDVQIPFLQRALGSFSLVPILVGDADPLLVDDALDLVWGGDETRIVISSDLSHFLTQEDARRIDRTTSQAIELMRADVLTGRHACGHIGVNALLQRGRRLDMRLTALDVRTSGDTRGNPERVVGYGAYAAEYNGAARLSDMDRQSLRDVAAESLRHGLTTGGPPRVDLAAYPPTLRALRGCFVTLTQDGKLRGCIGSVTPQLPLVEAVADAAFKAGFGDKRFDPLTAQDIDGLEIEIAVLGALRVIPSSTERDVLAVLQPDRDGLLIQGAGKGATFLPKVWSGLPQPSDFLRHLEAKAGFSDGLWPADSRAFRFSAESF